MGPYVFIILIEHIKNQSNKYEAVILLFEHTVCAGSHVQVCACVGLHCLLGTRDSIESQALLLCSVYLLLISFTIKTSAKLPALYCLCPLTWRYYSTSKTIPVVTHNSKGFWREQLDKFKV